MIPMLLFLLLAKVLFIKGCIAFMFPLIIGCVMLSALLHFYLYRVATRYNVAIICTTLIVWQAFYIIFKVLTLFCSHCVMDSDKYKSMCLLDKSEYLRFCPAFDVFLAVNKKARIVINEACFSIRVSANYDV